MSRLLERDDWVKALEEDDGDEPRPMRKGTALFVKGYDEAQRSFDMVISTEAVDRDSDTLRAAGWSLASYRTNPVVQWAHDHSIPAIARSVKTTVDRTTKALLGKPKFPEPGIHPLADMVHDLLRGKFLNAASVGFLPMEYERDEERGGYNFSKQELLEFSIVNVPANPEALLSARAAGIDLMPMKDWAMKVLDDDPDAEGRLWLPRKTIERALEIVEREPVQVHMPQTLQLAAGQQLEIRNSNDIVIAVIGQKSDDIDDDPEPEEKEVDLDPPAAPEPPQEASAVDLLAALLDDAPVADAHFTAEDIHFIGEALRGCVSEEVKEAVRQRYTALTGRLD
jgi:HK97 family phage prohead protease